MKQAHRHRDDHQQQREQQRGAVIPPPARGTHVVTPCHHFGLSRRRLQVQQPKHLVLLDLVPCFFYHSHLAAVVVVLVVVAFVAVVIVALSRCRNKAVCCT